VLAPGAGTTATLLLRALHPELCAPGVLSQVRFDTIMPALARGEADAGVAIHEGRFTYERHGLALLEDLGASWEHLTGAPVPLGGLLARRDLGAEVHAALAHALADSLALARRDPQATLPTMRRHARELEDAILWQHVELYVTSTTAELGEIGRAALDELARRSGNSSRLLVLG
jgi:1,4-dihydroxy-6-naphthoate synthase